MPPPFVWIHGDDDSDDDSEAEGGVGGSEAYLSRLFMPLYIGTIKTLISASCIGLHAIIVSFKQQ